MTRQVAYLLLILYIAGVLALMTWTHPQSPIGRCARWTYPETVQPGVKLRLVGQDDGNKQMTLTFRHTGGVHAFVRVAELGLPFPELKVGDVVRLHTTPSQYQSESVRYVGRPRVRFVGIDMPVDRGSLPVSIDGIYPVLGRSVVTQLASPDGSGTHLERLGNQNAVDIAAPAGASVVAMRPGRVLVAVDGYPDFPCGDEGWFDDDDAPHTGNLVVIEDELGVRIMYGHLRHGSVRVKVGDQVVAGHKIGEVGRSASGYEGSHLHLEAGGFIDDASVDHNVSVPLRFRICSDSDELRSLNEGEEIRCPVVSFDASAKRN